jgi:hypothetical protein
MEISSRYAWLYRALPAYFKWAGMAAFASFHVRLALLPFRLLTGGGGYAELRHSQAHRRTLLLSDIDTIRATNNGIFDDIFWVHVAYITADDGVARLRGLLGGVDAYAPVLAGFETIDRGRRVLDDATATASDRRTARELVWVGNVQLLEHEQRALVQPQFDRLSCRFAQLLSAGSTLSFEVRGLHHELAYFSSFYLYAFGRGMSQTVQARRWPRITRFEDRWRWITTSIVPRFRRLECDSAVVEASLRRIADHAGAYAVRPCVVPMPVPN